MRRSPWAIAERRKPAPNLAHVPSHTLRVPVLDRCEDPAPPVVHREDPPAVGAPHHVRRLRDDRPGMHPRWRPRCGESRLCARSTRSTRVRATRIPSKIRSRAWTSDGPRPGTASGRDRPASPPAASRPTPWASDPAARAPRPCAAAARVSAGRRAPSASAPTPDTRAGSRRGAPWPRRAWRSSPRPAASLTGGAAPPPVPAHAAARSPSTAPRCAASPRRASPPRGRPGGPARRALKTGHGPVPPVLQPVDLDAHFPRQRLQRFAAQQPQHHVPLPAHAPALPRRQGPRLTCRAVGGHSGRPPGSRRPRRRLHLHAPRSNHFPHPLGHWILP